MLHWCAEVERYDQSAEVKMYDQSAEVNKHVQSAGQSECLISLLELKGLITGSTYALHDGNSKCSIGVLR